MIAQDRFPPIKSLPNLVQHRFVHFIATDAGRRADTDMQLAELCPKTRLHKHQGLGHNAGDGPAPSGMNRGHHPPTRIMHQHRDAVSGAHRHHRPRLIRHERIPPAVKPVGIGQRTIDDEGLRPMNLFHRQDPGSRNTGCSYRRTGP